MPIARQHFRSKNLMPLLAGMVEEGHMTGVPDPEIIAKAVREVVDAHPITADRVKWYLWKHHDLGVNPYA